MSSVSVSDLPPTPTGDLDLRPGGHLGRFELRKALRQEKRAALWLALDPLSKVEVVVHVFHKNPEVAPDEIARWLQDAQRAAKVVHPHIVPVVEVAVIDFQPYAVFEHVAGQSLADVMQQRGTVDPHEAVSLMMDVLDALAVAHGSGVVHADLSNDHVLVDTSGRARVLNFGAPIGAPVQTEDMFAAGRMFLSMLSGSVVAENSDASVLKQSIGALSSGADDQLRAILSHALSSDPELQYPNARAFQGALDEWVSPAVASGDSDNKVHESSTLAFLLRRMRHKSDFPALSDSVVRIQSMANSETESIGSVTNEILKDVALTNKLLRLVNSAHYARGTSISTVSRAVTLVGFNGIRNMALSLVLLEHMQDKAHAAQIKEEFLRSLMAGTIAGELCPVLKESEEAFIGALFQNLGRLLVQFYFPEEARQVRQLVRAVRDPVSESTAAVSVLGLSFEELGLGVAKVWGLPIGIQKCMRKPVGNPPNRTPSESSERTLWTSLAANEMADAMLHCEPTELDARLSQLNKKYAMAIGTSVSELQLATKRARHKLIDIAAAMELRVPSGSIASKLLHAPSDASAPGHGAQQSVSQSNLGGLELHATRSSDLNASQASDQKQSRSAVVEILAAGIQDITNAMVEDFKLSDVLRMILETMLRAMEFDRIIFCMRDSKTDMMVGRFGLGQGVEAQVKVFKSHLKASTPDLFSVVCLNGSDTLISDAADSRIVQRLPDWYKKQINAPTFLVLPLQIKGSPFGLIYADKTVRDSLELDEKELALLRTLRNQAVMAFRQSN